MERYNGWVNYETWCCNLWLDNDGMSDEIAEWAKECVDMALENEEGNVRGSAAALLEDRIKEFIEERAEEWMKDQASMFSDLLNGALQKIDYREIAQHYLDDIKLFGAGWNMPGYMPDSEPAVFASFESAKAYIVDAIQRDAEESYEEAAGDKSATPEHDAALLALANMHAAFSIRVGKYAYWVTEA